MLCNTYKLEVVSNLSKWYIKILSIVTLIYSVHTEEKNKQKN